MIVYSAKLYKIYRLCKLYVEKVIYKFSFWKTLEGYIKRNMLNDNDMIPENGKLYVLFGFLFFVGGCETVD